MISGFFSLVLTGRLDLPSIFIFTTGLGVSCYRSEKGLPALLSGRGALLLSFAYIVFFPFDLAILSQSFIPASIHLVLFLQLAKLYQEKTDKDYFYLIVLSFLQILAASSLTIDISFVATLFLFLVALVSTLMSFDMYRSERKNTAQSQQVVMPLSGMSLWATVCILLTGFLLFLIIPRVGTGYFTRATAESLLASGFTDRVQLGDIGQVKLSNAVVMHARQISGTPFAVLKWRGIALDRFDGRNWAKTARRRFPLRMTADGEYSIPRITHVEEADRYEIFLEPLATTTLFGPHQIRALSGRLQGVEYDDDDSVYLRLPMAQRIQYEVVSDIPDRARMFADSSSEDRIPDDLPARYLQLPRDIDPQIEQLAKQITANGKSIIEKASLVEGYLKRNYRYTLTLSWAPGPQPLSTFLFQAKAGHCEYFASSMAILLRAAGIPTRLVNGFLMGEYNPVGSDYIIRESDAHSWVEVYIPGRGWMEFDPTPPDPNRPEINLAMQLSHYIDAMDLFWNSYVLVYDSGAQLQLFRSAQDRVQSLQTALRDTSDRWIAHGHYFSARLSAGAAQVARRGAFWTVFIAIVLAAAAYKHRRILSTQLQIWRVRQGRSRATEDVVEQLFYRAAHMAERTTRKRKPAETWREWILGLPDPHRRSLLERALTVFEKSKYGQLPVSTEEFSLLEQTIQDVKTRRP